MVLRRIALPRACRLKARSLPLLAGAVLQARTFLGLSALLGSACADLLGDVAVGQAPSSAPAREVSTGTRVAAPLGVDPTPAGEETLPSVPPLDVQSAGAPEEEPSAEPQLPARICEQGDFRCSGADVELCLDGVSWIPWQTCGSPRLCQSEPAGRCIPALCAPGQQRCVEGNLQRCDEELTGWSDVEACVTAAHCDPRQSQCLSAPCAPGQQRCNGDQLEACADDQLGWVGLEQCASAALCQAGEPGTASCVEPSCGEGAFRCNEAGELQVCNAARTDFDRVAQCATATLCNAELGRCEAPACNPGQHACTPAGELLLCNEARTGFRSQQPAVICGDTELCDAVRGVCEPIPLPPPPPPPVREPEAPPPVVGEDEEERGNDGGRRNDDDDDRRGRNDDDDDDDDRRGRNDDGDDDDDDDDDRRGRGRG